MRTAKPIVLGALVGLALVLAALAGMYASPWRQELYFLADPGLSDMRTKLAIYQDWLTQSDARIALQGPEADSLRTEQARVWRDYKAWRTRMGELARSHALPSASGFLRWTYSLRYWDAPAAVIALVLGALSGFLGARARARPAQPRLGQSPLPAPGAATAQARALSEFEETVKQVARISRRDTRPAAGPPPADQPPIVAPERVGDEDAEPTPPLIGEGRENRLFQVGAGDWDEATGNAPPEKPGLSMEDEDASEPGSFPGAMPPTTEVERVERRKEEVLKLARKGMTSSEISRRLRISQDQVEFIIRLRREKG